MRKTIATAGERHRERLKLEDAFRVEQEKVADEEQLYFDEIGNLRGTKGGQLLVGLWTAELQGWRDRLEDPRICSPTDPAEIAATQARIEVYNSWLSLLEKPQPEEGTDV